MEIQTAVIPLSHLCNINSYELTNQTYLSCVISESQIWKLCVIVSLRVKDTCQSREVHALNITASQQKGSCCCKCSNFTKRRRGVGVTQGCGGVINR